MTRATAIKWAKGTVYKTYDVELKCGGYEGTRMCYVAHLPGWDMILWKPVLQDARATISAGTTTVTIHQPGMDRFLLRI